MRWAFGVDTARQTETDSLFLARDRWFELTNESAECVQPATAVSTPKAQRTGRSPIAECFSNFSDQNCRSITVKAEWDAEIMWLYEYGVFMAILCVAL